MRARRIALCVLALAAGALAQAPAGAAELRSAIARAQQELQQARARAEALLDARIRHDFGLPADARGEAAPAALAGPAPPAATATDLDLLERELAAEDAATAELADRCERLAQEVARRQAEAARRREEQRGASEWLTVPVPGDRPPPAPREPREPPDPAGAAPDPGLAEPAGPRLQVVPNLAPIRAQIEGSSDRGRVAQALFRAGQALVDRGRELRRNGQDEAADAALGQARERLQRAVAELLAPGAADPPPLAGLFCLGRCRELLFRIAERLEGLSPRRDAAEYRRREEEVRAPFLQIAARDVVQEGGAERAGPWGRAAQAAMEHFRWMNLHGGFAPRTDPEDVTWADPSR